MIINAKIEHKPIIEKFLKIKGGIFKELNLPKDIFVLRIRCLYDVFKIGSEHLKLYLVHSEQKEKSEASGIMCIYGQSAYYIGAMQNEEEIESFLKFTGIKSFFSNDIMLSNCKANTCFLLKRSKNCKINVDVALVMQKPNLFELANSGVLSGINPDLFYAKAQRLVTAQRADICAIAHSEGEKVNYVATAGLYCIEEQNAFLQSVQTKEEHRGCGYASTLISHLAAAHYDKDIYLICLANMHEFYERLGFNLSLPLCEFLPNEGFCSA